MELLECINVNKSFGDKNILKDINLKITRGKIIGLLGKHGTGKTTLIKLINDLLTPTSGQILVNGKEVGVESKKIISYLPERTYLDKSMTIDKVIEYFEDFYDNFDTEKARKLLQDLDLDTTQKISKMSKGMQEKLQLVLVMSRRADLYILDEPLGGVDPATRDYILDTILTNFNEGASVIISTHLIADIERILDEVIFIDKGKIILKSDSDELRKKENGSIDEILLEHLGVKEKVSKKNSIIDKFYYSVIYDGRYKYIFEGILNTIIIALGAVVLGVLFGGITSIIRNINGNTGKLKILNLLAKGYVTIIRGTPVILQLMIIYYVIFKSAQINIVLVGILAFGINSGAYVAEIIRAGIQSVDKGQIEAGYALGLPYRYVMSKIVIPEALKNILPALGNEFITLVKETSVGAYIGIIELTKASDIIASRTYDYFFPLILVALIYLLITLVLTKVFNTMEERLNHVRN